MLPHALILCTFHWSQAFFFVFFSTSSWWTTFLPALLTNEQFPRDLYVFIWNTGSHLKLTWWGVTGVMGSWQALTNCSACFVLISDIFYNSSSKLRYTKVPKLYSLASKIMLTSGRRACMIRLVTNRVRPGSDAELFIRNESNLIHYIWKVRRLNN